MAEILCDQLNSGVKLGMMLLYNENNQRRYLDIPDSTIFQSPDIQSAYQDYLRSCNLLKEKTQSNTNQVAYDVFFEKNKAWILQEFSGRVVPVGATLEAKLSSIFSQLLGIVEPSRRDSQMGYFMTNPGNLRSGNGKYSGNGVEISLLTSTLLTKYKIPHYIASGVLTQSVPEGTPGSTSFWSNGKLFSKIEVMHSYIIVPGEGCYYLYDAGNGIFVKIPGTFQRNKLFGEISGLGPRRNLGLRISNLSKKPESKANDEFLKLEIISNSGSAQVLRGHSDYLRGLYSTQ